MDYHHLPRAFVPQLEGVGVPRDALGDDTWLGSVEGETGEHEPEHSEGDDRDLHGEKAKARHAAISGSHQPSPGFEDRLDPQSPATR
jgi:hypothetical protein